MASIKVSRVLVAFILALVISSVAQADLKFVVDSAESSRLRSRSEVWDLDQIFPDDSGWNTSAATSTIDLWGGPTESTGSVAISPFGQSLMGVSGIGQALLSTGDFTAGINRLHQKHVSVLESTTLPMGSVVVIDGEIEVTWNHGGDGSLLTDGSYRIELVDENGVVVDSAFLQIEDGVVTTNEGAESQNPDVGSKTVPFVFIGEVGWGLRMKFDSRMVLHSAYLGNARLGFYINAQAYEP